MKKLIKILMPILCLNIGILSGCKSDSNSKIMLSFGDMHANDVVEVKIDEISEKVSNKESFMLVVSSNTCVCWQDFHPIIQSYVKSNHLYCAHIDYNSFKDYAPTYDIQLTSGSTSFVVFEKGKAKIKLMSSAEDKTLKDLDTFKKFMEGNVIMPKMYLINENDINTINESGKNAIVYYERTKCGDCTYLNPYLFDYFSKHQDSPNIYVLDCQPWKLLTDGEYQDKKDFYGLSTKYNEKYGFDKGVFPYMSFISEGTIKSAAIAFNDEITKIDGKYKITNSYYTAERLKNLDYEAKVLNGLELPKDDVADNGQYITWMQDKAIKEYQPIVTNFLNTELSKTNFTF